MAEIITLKGGDAVSINLHNKNYTALNNDIASLKNTIYSLESNLTSVSQTLSSNIGTTVEGAKTELDEKIKNITGFTSTFTQTLTTEKETTLRSVTEDTSGALTKVNNVIYRPNKDSNQYSYGSDCILNTSALSSPLVIGNDAYNYSYKEFTNIKRDDKDKIVTNVLAKELEFLIPSRVRGKYSTSRLTFSQIKVELPNNVNLSGYKCFFEGSVVFTSGNNTIPTNSTAFVFSDVDNGYIPFMLTSKLTADTDLYIKVIVKAIKQEDKND